ncbi:MAG: hypothetical protein ACLVHY_03735 [Gemmiger sp.]
MEADRAIAALAGVQPDGCDINKITGTGHVLPPLGVLQYKESRIMKMMVYANGGTESDIKGWIDWLL